MLVQASRLANKLFDAHQPGVPEYASRVLSGIDDSALQDLDTAYTELVRLGLMHQQPGTVDVLPGIARPRYALTAIGITIKQGRTGIP
jgi:hypothetical protein